MKFKYYIKIKFIFFLLLLMTSLVWAQEKGKIFGCIVDSNSGEPLEKACVYLENTTRGAETNQDGIYFIPDLPSGQYRLTVMLLGYKSIEHKIVKIEPGEALELNFNLEAKILTSSDAIVVTATRGKSLTSEVPASVDVIGAETIEMLSPQNVAEVIDNVQGVFIKDYGGIGGTKTISLRGSSAEQVLVMMDGQRLNNAQNGQVDFSTLSTKGVEKIEIIRGGSSALYGADAVGGVINIITKKHHREEGVTGTADFVTGSFNSHSASVSTIFDYGAIIGSAGYKHLQSDGNFNYVNKEGNEEEKQNNDITSDDAFARLNWQFGDSLDNKEMDFSYKYYTSERGSPGTTELPYYKARLWNTNQQFNTNLSGKIFNFLNDFKIQGYVHYLKTRYKNDEQLIAVDSRYINNTYGFEAQMQTVLSESNLLTYGTGYRYDDLKSTEFPADHYRHTFYIFIQDEINFKFKSWPGAKSASLVPALRYDRFSEFGTNVSPKIGSVVNFGTEWQTSLKFNAGLNYRAPNFNELYWPEDPWTKGNPDLKPEHGFDWDVGLRLRYPLLNGIAFDLSYFNVQMKDLILWQSVGQIWKPLNVEKSRNQGIETNLSLNPLMKILNINANYTYLDAQNLSNDRLLKGKQLVYRPKHTANANIGLSWSDFKVQYRFLYVGRRHTTPANLYALSLDPYSISDIVLSWHSGYDMWDWNISFQVKNFLDEQYEIIRYQPNPGREYRLNFSLSVH